MTSATSAELDVLGALLAFDFIGFAQKSAALDPTDPQYGQAVGAAFGLAARRRFPQGATPQEISGYVADVLGSLDFCAADFDPSFLDRLVADGLHGGRAPGGEHPDPETTIQARLVLTLRLVRELGLGPDQQRELLAEAAHLTAV
ncbi:hypothetical protein G5C60_46465 [Streptomyces sp. HC44]|uniref:Uncharacterized protein n=1 Tax=Streptomyces scabichelini TaxID=2711217 RepID=A0A6G4VM49_9ACTN|nr:hypothetical protein [Streptomyces scabichelini]NGO14843.1 hypothetical protein [Streptomyces scabichelini]